MNSSLPLFDAVVSRPGRAVHPHFKIRTYSDTRNQTDMVYTSNGMSGATLLVVPAPSGSGYRAIFATGLKL